MKNLPLLLLLLLLIACNNKENQPQDTKEPIEISAENNQEAETRNYDNSRAIPNSENIQNSNTAVAVKFINDYITYCNNRTEQIGIEEWVKARSDVSEAFKNELSKMVAEAEQKNPGYGLGFDPIFDAQDYPPDGFELAEYNSHSNYLTVEAKSWEGFKITMKIKVVDNKWFVDGCGVINIPKDRQAGR